MVHTDACHLRTYAQMETDYGRRFEILISLQNHSNLRRRNTQNTSHEDILSHTMQWQLPAIPPPHVLQYRYRIGV